MSIFTIGYEGINTETFLTLLRRDQIETIVDVRELPLSRKAGFSKSALRDTLNLHGFDYLHVPELGCPKPIRHQYRLDRNWSRYTEGFLDYLAHQNDVIAELSAMAATTTCALLCFEADYRYCHRSMVADAMHEVSGMKVRHLNEYALRKGPVDSHQLALA
jgi:uncharacterized protein (DUF488 family)